jgi:hypothetical protein
MEALFTMGAQLLFRAPMDRKGAHGALGIAETLMRRSNLAELISSGRIYLIDGRRSPHPPLHPSGVRQAPRVIAGLLFY